MRQILFFIILASFFAIPRHIVAMEEGNNSELSECDNVCIEEEKSLTEQLMEAVTIDNIVGLQSLLEKGVDIDTRDGQGKTALMRAAAKKRGKIFEVLIEKGADVKAKDNNNQTVMQLTENAFRVSAELRKKRVQLLLAKGAIRIKEKVNIENRSEKKTDSVTNPKLAEQPKYKQKGWLYRKKKTKQKK